MPAVSSPNNPPTIVVMHGDQTGEELLQQALRVIDPGVNGMQLDFEHFDLGLENRRKTRNEVVVDAAAAMCRTGLGLKAATITPGNPDDVGSPNALLREKIDGKVILRTGRRIPRVHPMGGVHAPIAVVRMAVDDAYGAKEWREKTEDGDEIAYRTSRLSRNTCRSVADFAFQIAERMGAKVFGGPKYTVSPVYEAMFKEELDAVGEGFVAVVMSESPHGTAPALEGKNIANPMAMILACASLLAYVDRAEAQQASRAIYEAVFEAVHSGHATPDLGGSMTTSGFTDEVIQRVRTKIEVWADLH